MDGSALVLCPVTQLLDSIKAVCQSVRQRAKKQERTMRVRGTAEEPNEKKSRARVVIVAETRKDREADDEP